MEMKYLLWLWLALPLVVGAYPTIREVWRTFNELKEENER